MTAWSQKLHGILFEAEPPLGKLFDIGLLMAIMLSVTAVVLEKTHAKTVGTGGANEEAMEHPGSRAHVASLDAEATRARPTV